MQWAGVITGVADSIAVVDGSNAGRIQPVDATH
jgi:hypothetical protein